MGNLAWEVRENADPAASTLHLGYHDQIHYSSLRSLEEDPGLFFLFLFFGVLFFSHQGWQ